MPTYLGHTIQNGAVTGPLVNTTVTNLYRSTNAAKIAIKEAVEAVIQEADDQWGVCYTHKNGRFYAYQNNGSFATPSSGCVGMAGFTSSCSLLGNLADFLKVIGSECSQCGVEVILGSENPDNMAIWCSSLQGNICSECYMIEQSFQQECAEIQRACNHLNAHHANQPCSWNTDEGEAQFWFEFDIDVGFPTVLLLAYLHSDNGDQIMRTFGLDDVSDLEQFAVNNILDLDEWGV